MSWIIIKSAGDEYSFTVQNIPGDVGHTYQYAQQLAEKVTVAMKAAQQSVQADGCHKCGKSNGEHTAWCNNQLWTSTTRR